MATQAWQVIKVETISAPDATGRYVPSRRVTYQLTDGTVGQVNVPTVNATPDAVRAAIQADADNLSPITLLKSGG
jgi:hypothetical protein